MVSSGWSEISRTMARAVELIQGRIFSLPSEELGGPIAQLPWQKLVCLARLVNLAESKDGHALHRWNYAPADTFPLSHITKQS